ncbi:MAG: RagB/SusD family nutrient uptake outer membrane protein [Saprospiraceae bacterium]
MIRYVLGLMILMLMACTPKSNDPEFTIVDFENGLTVAYNYLAIFGNNYQPINDLSSDQIGIPGLGANLTIGDNLKELLTHTWTPGNTMVNNLWTNLYNGVNAANNTLAIAAEVAEEIGADELAEARALRAFEFFLLMDVFGNVQAFKEDVLSGNVSVPQLKRAEVFTFIETELKEIIPLLKPEPSYGKITRPVAQAILAKLYLNAEVYTGTANWAACRDACAAIIASNAYHLVDDYFDLFAIENATLADQSLLMVSTIPPSIHPSRLTIHPAQINVNSPSTSGFQNWAAIPEFYNLFDKINDKRALAFLIGPQKTANGTAILDASGNPIDYTSDYRNTSIYNSGARVLKYALDPTKTNYGDNDIVILRYADVLLMEAEALNELGDLNGAVALINQVRARAYTVAAPLNVGDFTQESLRAQILKERSQELMWEGWRRQDLIRHGQFCSGTWTQKLTVDDDCEKRKLFPIPQSVLDVNATLVQNPGY